MVKEVWDSFKDNIKERVTNPFLGTFLLVWIVQNWRVVYAFFNFDKENKLQNKIDYFNKYWTEHNFIWNLLWVALITVGVLLITYLFLALSRFLSNYFENIIIPFVYKLTKGKIVTYETYQYELKRVTELEDQVEEERKSKNKAIDDKAIIEKLYSTLVEEKNDFEKNKEKLILDQEKQMQENIKLIEERKTLELEKNGLVEEKEKIEGLLKRLNENQKVDYTKLIEKTVYPIGFQRELEETILDILKLKGFHSQNSSIDFLLKNDFIQLSNRSNADSYFKLTVQGEEFKNQFFKTQ